MARGVTLTAVRELALALPGATEEPHFDLVSFRVGELLEEYWQRQAPARLIAERAAG
jgi:hypothetical protein